MGLFVPIESQGESYECATSTTAAVDLSGHGQRDESGRGSQKDVCAGQGAAVRGNQCVGVPMALVLALQAGGACGDVWDAAGVAVRGGFVRLVDWGKGKCFVDDGNHYDLVWALGLGALPQQEADPLVLQVLGGPDLGARFSQESEDVLGGVCL